MHEDAPRKILKLDRAPDSPGIGFADWTLDARDAVDRAFKAMIDEMIAESIAIATKEYRCFAYFDWRYDKAQDGGDPTSIKVELPLGESTDIQPTWSFTLTDLIEGDLDVSTWNGKFDNPDTAASYVRLRDALRGLADRIDHYIVKTGRAS